MHVTEVEQAAAALQHVQVQHIQQAPVTLSEIAQAGKWKEPGPIGSDFFQAFWGFGIRRKLVLFSSNHEIHVQLNYSASLWLM